MHTIFSGKESEAILLVDANNAFNNLNRQVALHNISRTCPAIHPALVNAYRKPLCLLVGGQCLLSQEGTTQGDPLAMAMYSLATLPLIRSISDADSRQVWYADAAANGGKLVAVRRWWDQLAEFGPKYGYLPNGCKSWLIVKLECLKRAKSTFSNTNVNITTEGCCYLGGSDFL